MTREEAIEHGKEQLEVFGGEHREFIEMAIKALEKEPCKDCISRQAVLDYIHRIFNQGTGKKKSFEYIQKYVEKLPPVNPTKTGHWNMLDECANSGYYCSECRKKVIKEGWSGTIKKIKYCPNCGTKMV